MQAAPEQASMFEKLREVTGLNHWCHPCWFWINVFNTDAGSWNCFTHATPHHYSTESTLFQHFCVIFFFFFSYLININNFYNLENSNLTFPRPILSGKIKSYFCARKFRRYKDFEKGRKKIHAESWSLLTFTSSLTLNRLGIRLRGWTVITLRASRLSEALLDACCRQPSGFGGGSEGDAAWCQPSENSSNMFDNENDMFIYTTAAW